MTTILRPSDDEWMSLTDFAKILGKSVATLYNERARGLDFPPTYNFNKKSVRLRRSDVDAWLEKFRRVPASVQLQQQAQHPTT